MAEKGQYLFLHSSSYVKCRLSINIIINIHLFEKETRTELSLRNPIQYIYKYR